MDKVSLKGKSYTFELIIQEIISEKTQANLFKLLERFKEMVYDLKAELDSNKIIFSTHSKDSVDEVISALDNEDQYKVKYCHEIDMEDNDRARTLKICLYKGNPETIVRALDSKKGILDEPSVYRNICSITYDPEVIRGSDIIALLRECPEIQEGKLSFEIENPLDQEDELSPERNLGKKAFFSFVLCLALLGTNFIGDQDIKEPNNWGMFSYYSVSVLLATLIITYFSCFSGRSQQSISIIIKKKFGFKVEFFFTLVSLIPFFYGIAYFAQGSLKTAQGDFSNITEYILICSEMFQTSCVIMTTLLFGRYILENIKKSIFYKINELKRNMRLRAGSVRRMVLKNKKLDSHSQVEELNPCLIEKGDIIQVEPGIVLYDGLLIKGRMKVNQNHEECLHDKAQGQLIDSGSHVVTIDEDAYLLVYSPFEKSVAGKLFCEISSAITYSTLNEVVQTCAAKVSKRFIYVALIISALSLTFWIAASNLKIVEQEVLLKDAFKKFIGLLGGLSPIAFNIGIPIVYLISLRKALENGIIVKRISTLNQLGQLGCVVFNRKTITNESYEIRSVQKIAKDMDDATAWEIIQLAQKANLDNPVNSVLYQESIKRILKLQRPKYTIHKEENDKVLVTVYGSEGIIDKSIQVDGIQRTVAVGDRRLMTRLNINIEEQLNKESASDISTKKTISPFSPKASKPLDPNQIEVFFALDNEIISRILLKRKESPKDRIQDTIATLKEDEKEIYLLTEAYQRGATKLMSDLGIQKDNLLSEDENESMKDLIHKLLQDKKVLMIGSGPNDLSAIKAATLSCAINYKTSSALSYCDYIIYDGDHHSVPALFRLNEHMIFFRKFILALVLIYTIPLAVYSSGFLELVNGFGLSPLQTSLVVGIMSSVIWFSATLINCWDIRVKSKKRFVFKNTKVKLNFGRKNRRGEDRQRLVIHDEALSTDN